MHEVGVAESLMRAAAENVPEGKCLQNVHVTVGPLSGISSEALEFCFSVVAKDMGYEAVRLIITNIPAGFECLACHHHYETSSVYNPCPQCQSLERITLSGDRFSLDAIDVEDENHV